MKDFQDQVKRSSEKIATDDDKKEFRDNQIETKLAEVINFGVECMEAGSSISDIGDLICGGTIGKELWTITMFMGGGFASFGPKKLSRLNETGKGGTKGQAPSKAIKAPKEGLDMLGHLKSKSQEILGILETVVNGDVTANSVMGAASELCLMGGMGDKGRSLLNFSFRLLARYQSHGCFAGLQFDFAKCFDSIPYSAIWSTLRHYGCDSTFVDLLSHLMLTPD